MLHKLTLKEPMKLVKLTMLHKLTLNKAGETVLEPHFRAGVLLLIFSFREFLVVLTVDGWKKKSTNKGGTEAHDGQK